MSYGSLEQYIEDKHYDYIFGCVVNFYNRIKDRLYMHTYAVPYPTYIHLDEITVEKVYFKDDIFSIINEFKLVIRADFILKGNYKNDYEEDTMSRKFIVTCTGKLDNGINNFKVKEVEEYINNPYKYKSALSAFMIPYIPTEDLELRATDFLKKYCPEALSTPMPLPIDTIIKRMNVSAYNAPLGKKIFGKAFFDSSKETIYNDDNEPEEVVIPPRSILIDPDVFFLRNIGSYNNTVIHECVHIEYHWKYFELQKITNSNPSFISCKINGPKSIKTHDQKAFDYMEWQANMLAPRILMPEATTKIAYGQILNEVLIDYPDYSKGDQMDVIVTKLADFFNVSKQAAKVRLIDLGIDTALGVQNYINGIKVPNFSFKKGSLEKNQTFIIDFIDSVIQVRNNPALRELSQSGLLAYIDGFLVLNDPKFVIKDENGNKSLTPYALEHIDECAFKFVKSNKAKGANGDYYETVCFLCRPENKCDYVQGTYDPNDESNKKHQSYVPTKKDEIGEIQDTRELLKEMTGDFSEDLLLAINDYGFIKDDGEPNYYRISKLSQVSDHTIKNYCDGTTEPTKEKLLAICAGLRFHPRITYKLLKDSNITINESIKEVDMVYCALIERHYDEGLEVWNSYLMLANFTALPY